MNENGVGYVALTPDAGLPESAAYRRSVEALERWPDRTSSGVRAYGGVSAVPDNRSETVNARVWFVVVFRKIDREKRLTPRDHTV